MAQYHREESLAGVLPALLIQADKHSSVFPLLPCFPLEAPSCELHFPESQERGFGFLTQGLDRYCNRAV